MSERKRRELNLFYEYGTAPTNQAASEKVLFREVLPDDPSPEWVDELIRLCEREPEINGVDNDHWRWMCEIKSHMKERGEK